MATLYADSSGNILRLVHSATEADMYPDSQPVGTASTLDYDPSTNVSLDVALTDTPEQFTYLSGVLKQNGVTVTINAASQDYQTSQYLKQAIAVFKGTETLPSNAVIQNAFLAVQGGTATLLQTQIVAAVLARALGLMAQKLIAAGILG